jgi:protein-disulfide isomerase
MKYVSTMVVVMGLAAGLTTVTAAAEQNKQDNNGVVAQVGGTNLTTTDFENKEAGALLQARYQLYLAERKVLDKFVDQEILEIQAKKQGLTVDQLLAKEAYKGIKDPTDDQLEVYYEGVDSEQPFSAVRSQILDHIRQARHAKALAAYVETLKAQTNVHVMLAPPAADVDAQSVNIHGSKDAPITLVEFADFQCPYCAKVNPVLLQIEKEYGDKLAVVFKDFPLPMHKDAEKAAEGARCAGEQGKYWEYHDLLFSSHETDLPSLKKHAGQLNLDQAKFATCLDSGSEAAAVKKDFMEGQRLGLTGTPSFFVNGHFFSGAADSAMLHEILGTQLPASSSAGAAAAVPPTALAQASADRK